MNKLYKQNGITLIALIITIIVLLILAGISISEGISLVDKAKAETIETNMFSIKAKAKEYAENVGSLTWNSSDESKDNKISKMETENREEFQNTYHFVLIEDGSKYENSSSWYANTDNYAYYELSQEALENMGLGNLWDENNKYVVRCPIEDGDTTGLEMDIIYTTGIEYDGITYYNLLDLQEVL